MTGSRDPTATTTSEIMPPSHWIGTDLLPEGAKKAPKGLESEADTSGNDAKVAELEAKVAELEKQLEAAKAPKPAGRSGS